MSAPPSPGDIRRHAAALYERGEAPAEQGDPVPLVPHSLPREVAEALDRLTAREGITRTLEVGLGPGLGSLALCAGALEAEGTDARHTTIDPFQDESWRGAGRRALHESGAGAVTELIEEESQLALARLAAEGRRFGLALIDGDHRFDGAFVDLYFADRMLEPGGVVVVDDLWMPAIRSAVSYVEANLGYQAVADLEEPLRSRRSVHPLRRGARVGRVAVLRKARQPVERPYDSFEPFVAR